MPTQSIRAIESIEAAIMNKILYIRVLWLLSFKLDVPEKVMLGLVGAEKFRVELVPLSHNGTGKRRDGPVGNRGSWGFVVLVARSVVVKVVISAIVEVVVVPMQASLVPVMLFPVSLSCGWNKAFEKPAGTKRYNNLIVEGLVFMCNTGTALLICAVG